MARNGFPLRMGGTRKPGGMANEEDLVAGRITPIAGEDWGLRYYGPLTSSQGKSRNVGTCLGLTTPKCR